MSFMQPVIYGPMDGWRVETTRGTWFVPGDVESDPTKLRDYVEGEIQNPAEDVEKVTGYFGRMSAPGYLDCTDWTFSETEEGVMDDLVEYYGAGEEDEDDEDEDETTWEVLVDNIGTVYSGTDEDAARAQFAFYASDEHNSVIHPYNVVTLMEDGEPSKEWRRTGDDVSDDESEGGVRWKA